MSNRDRAQYYTLERLHLLAGLRTSQSHLSTWWRWLGRRRSEHHCWLLPPKAWAQTGSREGQTDGWSEVILNPNTLLWEKWNNLVLLLNLHNVNSTFIIHLVRYPDLINPILCCDGLHPLSQSTQEYKMYDRDDKKKPRLSLQEQEPEALLRTRAVLFSPFRSPVSVVSTFGTHSCPL